MKDRLDVDQHIAMHGICSELDIGYWTVHWILKDELNMSGVSRVSAHWVLWLLKIHKME